MARKISFVLTDNRIPAIRAKLPVLLEAHVEKTARAVQDEAKMSMRTAKSGRIYKVSKTGKTHQASAPGEAPAIDTGNLVNSMAIEKVSEAVYMVSAGTEYAQPLEFGSKRMAARPFLGPAVEKCREAFLAGIGRLFNYL